ncbi:Inositol 2-dehydrogenase [Aquisphaera giovannonii]|uniref:Inositol 2-dehydrogenase n=1 Tax=Aquisphaera giovannonii TaxID=406548 RepID=A0A5B9WBP6_9BACT|nr:Gfo/Idh/MocA family oxidoreductase [Aquisphaera giovannonii]QEH37694.1 Inositol 2-dehydrogenase [Aquisphaera giovannonii]
MNRRSFLQAGAAGLALSQYRDTALAYADGPPKRVGLIGSGWYGKCDLLRLIQVAPVEVVSICDVDRKMLDEAAELIASRQASKKKPRTYSDYRKMLAEKDLEIVLIATPDHWHALPMIAAAEAGADIYVQKPISVDVREGQAMVAAARKHGRVVQVGTQRRSTPHLIEARDRIINEGKLGKIGFAETYCYYHMRGQGGPDTAPPEYLDWDFWCGPAPMRPFNPMIHPRGWRGFKEYGNGILGDMCIHMLDMVRWMLGLGWPTRIASTGGTFVQKQGPANIPDTQTATFDFGDLNVVWEHRTWGREADPKYPWGATIYGDKGTLKLSVWGYDFIPLGGGTPIHRDVAYELDQYPEDKTEKDLEKHVAPAIRRHMLDFLAAIQSRGKPVADIEQGHISTSCCILANTALELGRTLAWDAEKGCVKDDEEATRRLARPYRGPWVHPSAG